jgi:hypothetical protein
MSKHPNVHFFTSSRSVLVFPYIFEVCHEVKGLMKQKKGVNIWLLRLKSVYLRRENNLKSVIFYHRIWDS